MYGQPKNINSLLLAQRYKEEMDKAQKQLYAEIKHETMSLHS